jgi:molybdopterin/thiamine biosynthesis adenylyltransferase
MFQNFDHRAMFREVTAEKPTFTAPALNTRARLPDFLGQERSASATFAESSAVVVGVGSVGRRIALHLARLGFASLWMIDGGRFDMAANLVTQEIQPADLGRSKSVSTGEACKAISPSTRVFIHDGSIQQLDPVQMVDADCVFLATDNLAAEVDVAQSFRWLGVPVIQGSVHGETLVAQVRFVNNADDTAPCLVCAYGPTEWQLVDRSTTFRCGGQDEEVQTTVEPHPTNSTSFLCALAADLAVMQWTRHALGLGHPVANTILQYCGYTHQTTQGALSQNRSCRGDHCVLQRQLPPRPLPDCTLRQLSAAVEPGASKGPSRSHVAAEPSFTLGDLAFVESAACGCGSKSVGRFLRTRTPMERCPTCGDSMQPEPFFSHRPAAASLLGVRLDRPRGELTAQPVRWVVVQHLDRTVLFTSHPTHTTRECSKPGVTP